MKTIGVLNENKMWLDNSAMSLLKTCPRKYYLRIEQAICLAEASNALNTGTICHEGVANYHKARLANHDFDTAKAIGLHTISKGMLTITNPDKIRNETVVMRVMNTYFNKWKDEPYETLEAEIGFAVDLRDFVFVGKIDSLKTHPAFGLLVNETKTTTIVGERWSLRTKPNAQIDGYVSAYYINTGDMPYGAILDIIPLFDETTVKDKKSVENRRPFRLLTTRSKQDVDNWILNTNDWYRHLIRFKDSGVWPQNTDACAPLMGFTCEYIPICSEYPNVSSVQSMNISSIYKRETWEPWEITKKGGTEE